MRAERAKSCGAVVGIHAQTDERSAWAQERKRVQGVPNVGPHVKRRVHGHGVECAEIGGRAGEKVALNQADGGPILSEKLGGKLRRCLHGHDFGGLGGFQRIEQPTKTGGGLKHASPWREVEQGDELRGEGCGRLEKLKGRHGNRRGSVFVAMPEAVEASPLSIHVGGGEYAVDLEVSQAVEGGKVAGEVHREKRAPKNPATVNRWQGEGRRR